MSDAGRMIDAYRDIRPYFGTPEEKRHLRELLKLGDAHNLLLHAQGLLTSSDEGEMAINTPKPDEYLSDTGRLGLLVRRVAELEDWIKDPPTSAPAEATNMRLLRTLLELNSPERIDEPIKPGESIVTIAFNGIKVLNDKYIGYETTKKILAQAQSVIAISCRKFGLVATLEIPSQSVYRHVSMKTDLPPDEIPAVIAAMEADIRSKMQDFISRSHEIVDEHKAKVQDLLTIGIDYDTASEGDSSFLVLKRSLLHTQAGDTLSRISGRLNSAAGEGGYDLSLLESKTVNLLQESVSDLSNLSGKEKTLRVEKLTRQLFTILKDQLGESVFWESGRASEHFFSLIRKENIAKICSILAVDESEGKKIFLLGRTFLDCLTTPAMIRYHESGGEGELQNRTSIRRRAIRELEETMRNGDVPTIEQKAAWYALARQDSRFPAPERGVTDPWVFETLTLNQQGAYHLVMLDLVGVGNGIARRAQDAMFSVTEGDYESYVSGTINLGEVSWTRIRDTFLSVAQFLTDEAGYSEWSKSVSGGLCPVEIRGDEMFIVLPSKATQGAYGLDENEIQSLIFRLMESLKKNEKASSIRVTVATGEQGERGNMPAQIERYVELMQKLSGEGQAKAKEWLEKPSAAVRSFFVRVFTGREQQTAVVEDGEN